MARVSGGYLGHGYSLGVEVKPGGAAHCYDCGTDVPKQEQLKDIKCSSQSRKSDVHPAVAQRRTSAVW
ncbi:MAG TPA: hypothetical protein VGQ87_02080 [Patescibacteria group bacterium]|jgi:hypothetical protein|nr:hypothetical protein [Patescibacteria group bacterium]